MIFSKKSIFFPYSVHIVAEFLVSFQSSLIHVRTNTDVHSHCPFPFHKRWHLHTLFWLFLWIMYLKDPSLSGHRELHHSSLHGTVLQCMGELSFNQSPTDGCLGCSSLIFKMLGLFFLSFKTTKQTKQPLGWIMGTLNASGGKCWAAPRPEFTARMLACTLQKPWLLGCQWERKSLGEQLQVSPV